MRWAAAWRGGSWTPDAGAAAKLVANPPLFGTVGVLAEALALAQLIAAQAERRREAVKANDYPPRFTLALAHKDANLVSDAGTDLRIAQAARSWLADADAASWGERDYSALVAWVLDVTDQQQNQRDDEDHEQPIADRKSADQREDDQQQH